MMIQRAAIGLLPAEGYNRSMPRAILDDRWAELVRQVQTQGPILPEDLGWRPEQIVLTRGCDDRPHEAVFCERLIAAFSGARVVDARHIPHNRVSVPGDTSIQRIERGKRVLVLGAMRKPISQNADPETGAGTLCTAYYAVHPAWFCLYNCAFCYLSGSPGVRFSPTVRLFTNLYDILLQMQRVLAASKQMVSFYVGKVQDGLQLDPIGGFSRVLAPFVRAHENAHLVFLTKSTAVDGLIDVCPPPDVESDSTSGLPGRVAVSWSLNAPEVCTRFEWGAPSFDERLRAARRCADAGLPVRFVFMPLIPIAGWREAYSLAIRRALGALTPARITLGGICSYPGALHDTAERLGPDNLISSHATAKHGRRLRYEPALRAALYRHAIDEIKRCSPQTPVSLCLESEQAWRDAGLDPRQCRCNCIEGTWDLLSPGT